MVTHNQVEIRWQQRFDNFLRAFSQLEQAIKLHEQRPLSELEKQGMIQAFEFTHELAWNVLKDYLEFQGAVNLIGSRDTSREAFQKNLIIDGDAWMEMIKSRNLTSHTYNQSVADEMLKSIVSKYFACFHSFKTKMSSLSV